MIYKNLVQKISIPADRKTKQKDYLLAGQLPIIDQGKKLIGGYSNDLTKTISCDLPVIVFGDHTKVVKYISFPFGAGADGIKILKPKENIFPKYLYYATQYLTLKMEDKGYARHYQHLEKKDLSVPPLEEQQRIVARIEELFSELDAAVATLERTKELLIRYQHSVIDTTIPFTPLLSIKDCISEMGQGWSPKCLNTNVIDDGSWAVIKTTAVQARKFVFEENKKLPETLEPRVQHELVEGDILITRAGPKSRCGICCMVRKTKKRLLNSDKVYRIKINERVVTPQYLECVLNSPKFIEELNLCKTGGNDSGLNLTQKRFLSMNIPIPSLLEQEEIVSEIESRLSVCDKIEETVTTALQEAEAMRQSILKQAFAGEL